MREWNEIEQEMKLLADDMPEQKNLEEAIERSINKKIRHITVRTVAVLLGAVMILFLMISPMMDMAYLNPVKLEKSQDRPMFTTLRDYFETTRPYVEIADVKANRKGFARYELELQVLNHRDGAVLGMPNAWIELVRGTYEGQKDVNQDLTYQIGRFAAEKTAEEREALLTSFGELPKSAYIYLSIGEREARAVAELREESVNLEWMELYQPNVEFQGGLNLYMQAAWRENDKREDMTEEELKEVYLMHLDNLIAHPEIWDSFGLPIGDRIFVADKVRLLKECYEDAKTLKTLETKNYCISGKRDDIIAYMEKRNPEVIHVDAVKLSEFPQE